SFQVDAFTPNQGNSLNNLTEGSATGDTTVATFADPIGTTFSPGNLVVSRSVYTGTAGTVTVGSPLPGGGTAVADGSYSRAQTITAASALGTTVTISVPSVSGFAVGQTAIISGITTSGYNGSFPITAVDTVNKTFSYTASSAPASPAVLGPTPLAYENVWQNEALDASFGVTSPIFLDQLTTSGTLVGSPLNVTAALGNTLSTSFPSKSELALNLSTDGTALTFMAYESATNALDVSNSDTPNHIDPTNPVGTYPVNQGTTQRAVAQIDANGNLQVTPVNAYSGNNGR